MSLTTLGAGRQPAGGGGAFSYDAVNLDGSTYLTLPFADIPWVAGRQITVTGFFKTSNTGGQNNLVVDTNGYFALQLNVVTGRMSFQVFDPTAASSLSFVDTLGVADGAWHSFGLSIDTNFGAGAKLCKLVIDKNLRSPVVTDLSAAFDMGLVQSDWNLGSQAGGNNFLGDFSEFTLHTSYVDFTSGANIAKFFDGSNKPVDLGADGSTAYGVAAKEYHHIAAAGTPADWALNRGGGTAWTVTGALTLAGTKP